MKTSALKGARDTLPHEEELRGWLLNTILDVYRASGFFRIATPIIEDAQNISHSDGGDNLNLVFRVLKRGEKLTSAIGQLTATAAADTTALTNANIEDTLSDIALRYDLTLPLVRYYSDHKAALPSPFKVIQSDRVYRAERPQKGRLREFTQCDIDIIGDDSINAEIELIDITTRALMAIGFSDFTLNINDRRILRAMLLNAGFAADTIDSVCITFDKLDKIGVTGVKDELSNKGCPAGAVDKLCAVIESFNKIIEGNSTAPNNDALIDAICKGGESNDLRTVIKAASQLSGGKYNVRFNPALVRGQGYYTGLVFEITTAASNSAIAGGGRYDKMVEKFTGVPTAAVGFSIGFERIYSILQDGGFKTPVTREKCALLYGDEPITLVLNERKKLQSTMDVAIFHKTKKMAALYSMLEAAGFTKFATIKDGVAILKENAAL